MHAVKFVLSSGLGSFFSSSSLSIPLHTSRSTHKLPPVFSTENRCCQPSPWWKQRPSDKHTIGPTVAVLVALIQFGCNQEEPKCRRPGTVAIYIRSKLTCFMRTNSSHAQAPDSTSIQFSSHHEQHKIDYVAVIEAIKQSDMGDAARGWLSAP